jgi:hypothetical protein
MANHNIGCPIALACDDTFQRLTRERLGVLLPGHRGASDPSKSAHVNVGKDDICRVEGGRQGVAPAEGVMGGSAHALPPVAWSASGASTEAPVRDGGPAGE